MLVFIMALLHAGNINKKIKESWISIKAEFPKKQKAFLNDLKMYVNDAYGLFKKPYNPQRDSLNLIIPAFYLAKTRLSI